MENAEALALLAVVAAVMAFFCRTGVHAYFFPKEAHIRVLPPGALPEELVGPAADLEALGFRRMGVQEERLPMALSPDTVSHAFANPEEGIYANLSVSSVSDLPVLYFFSTFADGGWALTVNHQLPVLRPEVVNRWRSGPGLVTQMLLTKEAERGDADEAGTIAVDDIGVPHAWSGGNFRSRGVSCASWEELPTLLETHRGLVQELAATLGPPRAEATPEARVAAAQLYYSHPANAYQTRLRYRASVQMLAYMVMASLLCGAGAVITWALTRGGPAP